MQSTSKTLALLTLAALGLAAALPQAAHAQLSYTQSRTDFSATTPGLTTETFEAGKASGSGNGPLDKATSNGQFSPGQIADGLRLNFVGSAPNQYYFNNSSSYNSGNGTKVITTNYSSNSIDFTFYNNNATAVGLDMGSDGVSGNLYTVSAFGLNDVLLGTTTVTPDKNQFAFLGITSLDVITRLNVACNNYETIDNVSFNAGPAPGAALATPEPSSVAAFAFTGLGALGLVLRARKRTA